MPVTGWEDWLQMASSGTIQQKPQFICPTFDHKSSPMTSSDITIIFPIKHPCAISILHLDIEPFLCIPIPSYHLHFLPSETAGPVLRRPSQLTFLFFNEPSVCALLSLTFVEVLPLVGNPSRHRGKKTSSEHVSIDKHHS